MLYPCQVVFAIFALLLINPIKSDKKCILPGCNLATVTSNSWSIDAINSMSDFSPLEKDSYGSQNRAFVKDPVGSVTVLRVKYPAGSYNPSAIPVGGTGFYSTPLDLSTSNTVTMSYQVYFPIGFNFVKGGKLPGLYAGHTGCSGGNAALDCFSTRFMFRTNGAGELYIYVDQKKQVPGLCQIPPFSYCNPDYGASIGRGSFYFKTGQWNSLSQKITLNTPGLSDGKMDVIANGVTVITFNQVNWRNFANVTFRGIEFETFFGGSDSSWATPIDQYSFFKRFQLVRA